MRENDSIESEQNSQISRALWYFVCVGKECVKPRGILVREAFVDCLTDSFDFFVILKLRKMFTRLLEIFR